MAKTIILTEEQGEALVGNGQMSNKQRKRMEREMRMENQRVVEDYIREYTSSFVSGYLDTPMRELPSWLQPALYVGDEESGLYKSVADNQDGHNRLLDFMRINLYQQFGVYYGHGPEKYIQGIARIALADLHYYSFDPNMLDGGGITKLSRLMRLIVKDPETMLDGVELDKNLNGWDYRELMEVFAPKLEAYRQQQVDVSNVYGDKPGKYSIYPIQDIVTENMMVVPTDDSKNFLFKLHNYTDWCICDPSKYPMEYAQYVCGGGKFYICLQEGFENVQKVQGDNCPLDEYGLSMIAILVGPDGLPDNVTTRWNHEFGGENHSDLWEAEQVSKLMGVNFFNTFKPRDNEQLRSMRVMNERKAMKRKQNGPKKVNQAIMLNAAMCDIVGENVEDDEYKLACEPDSTPTYFHVCKEEKNGRTLILGSEQAEKLKNSQKTTEDTYKPYFDGITDYMRRNGVHVDPTPEVELNEEPQKGLFITTGYYQPEEKKITLFTKDRHPKDVLRSFAHEMIHHSQKLDGKDMNFSGEDSVDGNKSLEELEADAYLRGNLMFRKWTEDERRKLNESKKKKKNKKDKTVYNDKGEVVPEFCDKCGSKVGVYICGEPVYKCTNKKCHKYFGTMPFSLNEELEMMFDEETDPDSIDLSSFNIKKDLNPKFWKDGKLDSRIRLKLLDIADDFIRFMGIDWVEPSDIILTGSIANYTWNSKSSDIDLHVVMDYSKIDDNRELVDNYLYAQKTIWNEEHDGISIYGFNVELFVEDESSSETRHRAVYSLEKNEWVVPPDRESLATSKVDKSFIRKKVAEYMDKTDEIKTMFHDAGDDTHKISEAGKMAGKLFDRIKKERKKSLEGAESEITNGNVIFKCLRRLGCIADLREIITTSYDISNSL